VILASEASARLYITPCAISRTQMSLFFYSASNAIEQRYYFMVTTTHIAPYYKDGRYLQVRIIDFSLK
jgi:hypothetical protein